MTDRQSSPTLSTLASKILNTDRALGLDGATIDKNGRYVPVEKYNTLLDDAQSLAGSVMSQDRTPGQG